mgnify:FL=1
MTNFKNKPALDIAYAAVIAAIYVVLTLIFAPISYGPVQVRVSEALCVLPIFTPAAVPGIFIGCLLANAFGGAMIWDVVFGSLASLLAAYISYFFRDKKVLAYLSPIVINALVVPFVLKYAYGAEDMIWYMMITVGIGEVISVGILGSLLSIVLEKYRNVIFK